MNSTLLPEAYSHLLDSGRSEDDESDGEHLFANADPQQQPQYNQQLLSFVDWDVLNSEGAARILDHYASRRNRTPTLSSRKCPLRKPAHVASLPPLLVSPATGLYIHTDSAMNLTPRSAHERPPSQSESDDDTNDHEWLNPQSPQRSQSSPPFKPRRRTAPAPALPPLDVHVLQRRRVFLSAAGAATIGIEEIMQLQERPQPTISADHHSSPLQLALMPKKCSLGDEVALMPCHSLLYRYVPSLSAEIWKEPIRDRDKHWVSDELSIILALTRASEDRTKCLMSNPMRQIKGKWRHWETMKLHIHSHEPKTEAFAASPQRDQSAPSQILIRNQGVMISKTFCLVSVFGVGIYGRLYSTGLVERHGNTRYLRFQTYDPQTSCVFELIVTFSDLEWLFEARKELLVAGKKHEIIKELIALLYFKYPASEEEETEEDGLPSDQATRTRCPPEEDTRVFQPAEPQLLPVLCISPEEKLNAAARRRREREERLRLEEAERLRALALFKKLPRRARYRVLCQIVRVNGHKLIVSIYHNPAQIRNFTILAYHPPSSRTFPLTLGVMEAASLSRIFTLPHKWSAELKLHIARSLLPMLRFNGAMKTSRGSSTQTNNDDYADYRMGLGIREDRSGAPADWLPPVAIQTPERLQAELVVKFQVDGHRSLQLDSQAQLQLLETANAVTIADLEAQIRDAEAQKTGLQTRDHELKERIEEINSGKGVVLSSTVSEEPSGSKGHHHERRREFKAARVKIKDELKALNDSMSAWKREIQRTRESETLARAKAAQNLEKALKTLPNEALISTRGILPSERDLAGPSKLRVPLGQKTWLARAHIDPILRFVASGACKIEEKRYRCSVFVVLDQRDEASDGESSEGSEETATTLRAQESHANMLQVSLYNPSTCRTNTLRLLRLDWIAYTKQQHDAQLLIPEFEISSSPVMERLGFLDVSLATCRQRLTAIGKKIKKLTKKSVKLRDQVRLEMQNCLLERKKLVTNAPWHRLIAVLGERLNVSDSEVHIDRCIFRTVLPIVSLVAEDESPSGQAQKTGDDAGGVVYCHVRVVQEHEEIRFEVFEPLAGAEYALVYPESDELVKEFAVETFLEQQMHLEAIAMSLLFYVNDVTGQVDIRFEE